MDLTPVSQLGLNSSASPVTTVEENTSMGKNDFLMLLLKQLEVQDPLNPADPQDFAAQLAQFSSLEQMMSMNETLNTLSLLQSSMNSAQAAGFIGREILANGSSISVTDAGVSTIEYDLADDADSVTVEIFDDSGALVRTVEVGRQADGQNTFEWDGLNDQGQACANGHYTYSIVATDAEGAPVEVSTYLSGVVTGVVFEGGVTYLEVNGQRVMLADVLEVREAAAAPASH